MNLRIILFFIILSIITTNLFSNEQLKNIKVQLQWKHQFEFAGFYMAKEKGFYKDIGLDVDLIEFVPNMDIVDEILSERKDIGIWGAGIISEWQNSKDIVLLANYFKRSPLALITRPEIRIPSDLKNKKIMIHESDANSANYQQMFKSFNISKNNMNFIEPVFNISTFDIDKVDAYSIFLTNEPYYFIQDGTAYNILDPNNYGVEFYDVNMFTSGKFAKDNPLLLEKFINATNMGWSYALNNIVETVDLILEKYNTQKKDKNALIYEGSESKKFILPKNYEIGSIDIEKVRRISELYVELGLSKKRENIEDFVFSNKSKKVELNDEEKAFLKLHPTIVVASDTSYPPLDYISNGKPSGYSIELIEILLKSLGFNVEFKIGSNWSEQIKKFENNEIDILTSVFESSYYKKNAILTNSFLKAQDTIVIRNGDTSIKSANDLVNKIVALPRGYTYLDLLKDKGIDFNYFEVENMDEAIQAVLEGKADATIESDLIIDYLIDKKGYINLKRIYKIFDDKIGIYHDFLFAVNKNYPILADMINKALDSISVNQRRDLKDKWFKNKVEPMYVEKIQLTEEEEIFIKENKIINVSNETDYPPFDFTIGKQPYGYSIDLLNLISKKLGLEFNYINGYSWTQLVDKFKNNEIDLLHTLSKTDKREELGDFTDSFIWYQSHFLTRVENPEINDIKDLYGKVVAVGSGWADEEYLSINHPKIKLLAMDSLESMLKSVSIGESYALVASDLSLKYMIKKKGFNNLKISSWFREMDRGENRSFRFLTVKDKPILNDLLNKGLKSLTLKELDDLESKWFGKNKNLLNDLNIRLDEEEISYLKKKSVIKMCVNPNWMPLEKINSDLKHDGIAADLIKNMVKKLNIDIQLVNTKSWEQSLEYVQNRKCDILSLVSKTPERTKYLEFTTPYLSFPFVIATLNKELFIEDIEHIVGKKIAYTKGYEFFEFLKKKYPKKEFVEVENTKKGLELLSNEEVFAFIDTLSSVAYTIQENKFIDIKIAAKLDEKWELSVGTRGDEPLLNRIFQKAINNITESDKQEAYNKWFSVRLEQVIDYTILWKILFPVLFVVFITIYWNRKLYKEKEKTKNALAFLKLLQNELEVKNKELEKISNTDKLTGLYNRHKIDETLEYELLRFKRSHHTFGLIILDIDFFKDVNDKHGHNIGDDVLFTLGEILLSNIRKTDIIGRWGGEEFLIIVPEVDKDEVYFLAEKLRKEIEKAKFDFVGKITCSFGVTISDRIDSEKSIVNRADKALYKSKSAGRNRVEFL